MLRVSSPGLAPSQKINRKEFPAAQEIALGPFGKACRGLWGADAALELAARAKSSLRVAEYKIAGRVKPNGVDVAVIVAEITSST